MSANADVQKTFEHFGKKIKSTSRLTQSAKLKITTRLKTFSVEELKTAIDQFSKDEWWVENNSNRGVAWFFHNDDRIDQFLNLEPGDLADPALLEENRAVLDALTEILGLGSIYGFQQV